MTTTLKSVISGMCALVVFGSVGAIELNEREKSNLEQYESRDKAARMSFSTGELIPAEIIPLSQENIEKVTELMGSLEEGKVAAENSLKVVDFEGKKYLVFNLDRPSHSEDIYTHGTEKVSTESIDLLEGVIGRKNLEKALEKGNQDLKSLDNNSRASQILRFANFAILTNTAYIYGQLTK